MFEYIRGKLIAAQPHKSVVDLGHIGYRILIGLSTYARLPHAGQEVLLYLSPVVREDAHLLYGFLTEGERDLFEKLNGVTGIGPKTALALTGHMEIGDLQMAILQGNVLLLSKVPGIGKKTAERLVVEMRDKVKNDTPILASTSASTGTQRVMTDAISALVNLGYQPLQAQKAVKKALENRQDEPPLGALISLALRAI